MKLQFLVLTNNLRCFDETDVRTSQKTTYAQFKIYRTNFIDEIGPRFYLYFGKELISFLSRANVRAFHEIPNRLHTELTFINS